MRISLTHLETLSQAGLLLSRFPVISPARCARRLNFLRARDSRLCERIIESVLSSLARKITANVSTRKNLTSGQLSITVRTWPTIQFDESKKVQTRKCKLASIKSFPYPFFLFLFFFLFFLLARNNKQMDQCSFDQLVIRSFSRSDVRCFVLFIARQIDDGTTRFYLYVQD